MPDTTRDTTPPTQAGLFDPRPAASTTGEPLRTENSTDATRGEPLAMRAHKRKIELEVALTKLGPEDQRTRDAITQAVASIDALMTGDVEHLSQATASDLSRLLETSKHIGELPEPLPPTP